MPWICQTATQTVLGFLSSPSLWNIHSPLQISPRFPIAFTVYLCQLNRIYWIRTILRLYSSTWQLLWPSLLLFFLVLFFLLCFSLHKICQSPFFPFFFFLITKRFAQHVDKPCYFHFIWTSGLTPDSFCQDCYQSIIPRQVFSSSGEHRLCNVMSWADGLIPRLHC